MGCRDCVDENHLKNLYFTSTYSLHYFGNSWKEKKFYKNINRWRNPVKQPIQHFTFVDIFRDNNGNGFKNPYQSYYNWFSQSFSPM